MGRVGHGQYTLPFGLNILDQPVVDHLRGHHRDPAVTELRVVPLEEWTAEYPGIHGGSESIGELRVVLQRLELALRERVIVGHMRPAVALADPKIGQQQGRGLGFHGRATVGMKDQLSGADSLLRACLLNELLGQCCGLPGGHHPADHVAAEDVQDHVQVEVGPLDRAPELRDVPVPNLVGTRGQQFGLRVRRVFALVAPPSQ